MKRTQMAFLQTWLKSGDRKPLVVRGARQVGKTWLIREFAKAEKRQLIEINFEKKPQMASLFASNNPIEILLNLSSALNVSIHPENSVLFLDEIQEAPHLLAKLRWFAEELPLLPTISAGSLLEFVLANHSFSMPVGRISYMYLEPLSFEEYLAACDKISLVEYVKNYQLEMEIPAFIHEQLLSIFKEYLIVGGMPAATSHWIQNQSLSDVDRIHHDLTATYRDDFAKYSGRIAIERLDEVMLAIPKHLGEKFVYSKVNPTIQTPAIKQSLDLLCKARICHRIQGSAANGVPLAAEIQSKYLKMIFLDVGLCSTILGLSLHQLATIQELNLINNGAIAEQVVGQLLRTVFPSYVDPSLYYWHREEKGSAEIDYVIQHGNQVIPIEVKAGKTGSLKSLHLFMRLKKYSKAVRINSDFPSQTDVHVKGAGEEGDSSKPITYTLLSLPFYLLGQLHRLLSM